MRSADEQDTDSLAEPMPPVKHRGAMWPETGSVSHCSLKQSLRLDGLPQTQWCHVNLCRKIQKIPRSRFLPSQEKGVRIKVIENGESSIFAHWS